MFLISLLNSVTSFLTRARFGFATRLASFGDGADDGLKLNGLLLMLVLGAESIEVSFLTLRRRCS